MLPPIQDQYPSGHAKLVSIKPECNNPKLDNYSACLASAGMLESSSPEQVTTKFLAHWEEAAFGTAERRRQIGEGRLMPADSALESTVWGNVRRDQINATQNIVMPVLKKIYTDKSDDYSSKMLKQADLVILDSKSSFDTFKEIHTHLLKANP